MNIAHHVSDLLYEHECVVLPGLGAFITRHREAKIHPVKHTFSPPESEVLFNQDISDNGDLLTLYVSKKESIPIEKAKMKIQEFVRECIVSLCQEREVLFDRIGKLVSDSSGKVSFIFDENYNFNGDSFGLKTFVSPVIIREEIHKVVKSRSDKSIKRSHDYTIHPEEGSKFSTKRVFLRTAAAIVIGIAMSGSFFLGQKDIISTANILSFLPKIEKGVIIKDQNGEETAEVVLVQVEDSLKEDSNPTTEIIVDEIPESITKTEERFHIIAGAFTNEANAIQLMEELKSKGFHACLLGRNSRGLQRVSYGIFSGKVNALQTLEQIRSRENSSAWLYAEQL